MHPVPAHGGDHVRRGCQGEEESGRLWQDGRLCAGLWLVRDELRGGHAGRAAVGRVGEFYGGVGDDGVVFGLVECVRGCAGLDLDWRLDHEEECEER